MNRIFGFAFAAFLSVLTAVAVSGCSSESVPVNFDTFQRDESSVDTVGDADSAAVDSVERDIAGDSGQQTDTAADTGNPDVIATDVSTDNGFDHSIDVDPTDSIADVPTDQGSGEDANVNTGFCRGYDDCADDEVCIFSLGQCARRATWTSDKLGLFSIHAMDGAAGDKLVIDGERFVTGSLVGGNNVRVKVGTVMFNSTAIMKEENRLIINVGGVMAGPITVYDPDNKVATIKGPFVQSAKGMIECDGSTPEATGVAGAEPWRVGPYAAGYLDVPGDSLKTRVFYPAECGSVRRPPVAGTWPLVVILHGNGALHLNYEYLAELLATWGFVSIIPETLQNMQGEPYEDLINQLRPLLQRFRATSLEAESDVLKDVSTTPEVFWIGHSRGTGRIEEMVHANEALWDNTKGAVFLGPVDDNSSVPGLLMVFGGGKDSQSGSYSYELPYNYHEGPRWLVELPGGNHGSFCDSKVYGYGTLGSLGDRQPTITRHRQHQVVQTFAIPVIQRAFGLEEPFADYVDSPPAGSDYTVQHD